MADLKEEWKQNATSILGIRLHPLGEISLPDFVLESADDRELTHIKLTGIYRQLIFNLLAAHLFVYNSCLAFKMILAQRRSFPGWLCLIPAVMGMGAGLLAALSIFPTGLNCRKISCVPQLLPMYFGWASSPVTIKADTGCIVHYSYQFPWYWFGLTAPINAFFSAIFAHVAYKQYRTFGSDAWKRLTRDGIRTMCLVVLCNIFCATGIIIKLGGMFSEMFLLVDWLFTSTILVNHCYSMRKAIALSNRPKTENMLRITINGGENRPSDEHTFINHSAQTR
ncbi:hypothetical protein BDF19DRAFT_436956 [Syncephalis fuscata]|nr:hypothetical protein BDF19DRAFT_436956 [Syncephalis fuscata]